MNVESGKMVESFKRLSLMLESFSRKFGHFCGTGSFVGNDLNTKNEKIL